MKAALIIVPIALLCILTAFVISEDAADQSDGHEGSATIVSEEPGQTLYRADLKNGPLYYYECDTENGTITKIVAIVTMTLDIVVD